MKIERFFIENPEAAQTLRLALKDASVTEISPISIGATNQSYLVRTGAKSYVLRIPGADSNTYIDRYQEKKVYDLLSGHAVTDPVVYLNPENGHKVSEYYENARSMDVTCEKDIDLFISAVRHLHDLKLKCRDVYDFGSSISAYEQRSKAPGWFDDYADGKEKVLSLQEAMPGSEEDYILIHNDLSPENCLIVSDGANEEKCILIDFEYAAMQSPMADIAYFCVFANLNEAETDKVIDRYFDGQTPASRRAEVYAYMALNGLLHCNWLGTRGEERREEAQAAYTMAKRYAQKAKQMLR